MNSYNLCTVGEMVARSAIVREESRGAHYREDFPALDDAWLKNIFLTPADATMQFETRDVVFTHADHLRHD